MAESRRSAKRLRCAIYTRKSSEEGLEQAFNSLDAQREACARHHHRNPQRQEPTTTHRQEADATNTANTGRLG